MDVRQEFRSAAREQGVPVNDIERWVRLARPQTELVPKGDGLPVAGRFGGLAALPEGTEWPAGQCLVLTLDLAAIPSDGHDLDLPADGSLLFFVEPDFTPTECRVVHVPAGTPVTEHPNPGVPVFDPIALHARAGWSLPEREHEVPFDLRLDDEVEEAIGEVMWYLGDNDYEFSLGGYGAASTGGADNPILDAKDHLVLTTVWLDEGRVGDAFGETLLVVNFMIKHADLAGRAFDKIWLMTDFNG
ncbi:hypothetical protein ACTI_00790 [Actinoplanes sp. OR16]|uniref:DUF1963 domain-containing protein n=1 Tax=Actinoplanes sp. OR16 TaxID=946334 RepID=UPI000F6C3788|nr:DUF1963 domain-containing protein [Actinoplanes sp. OR16]BBH63394.1 hypothetical protein ACTI_00790 [Actinoplanes sp. OR16]